MASAFPCFSYRVPTQLPIQHLTAAGRTGQINASFRKLFHDSLYVGIFENRRLSALFALFSIGGLTGEVTNQLPNCLSIRGTVRQASVMRAARKLCARTNVDTEGVAVR
jgi:hypothetical protein